MLKVFGERNTGTRAVIRMIRDCEGINAVRDPVANRKDAAVRKRMMAKVDGIEKGAWKRIYREAVLDTRARECGPIGAWKHSVPVFDPVFAAHEVRVLFTVRNPYSWLLSMHRRPYHRLGVQQDVFEEFLEFPWLTVGRENMGGLLGSPVELWSRKLASYLAFETEAGRSCGWVRFEEFVQDPVQTMSRAAFEATGVRATFQVLEASTKKDGVTPEARRAYYAGEVWKDGLSARAVRFINKRINWDLAGRFGYERLDPADFDG